MTERRLLVLFLVAAGLVVASARCSPKAHADEAVLVERGSTVTIQRPDGSVTTMEAAEQALAVVTRAQIDRANAAAEMSRRLAESLTELAKANRRLAAPEPPWKSALRWSAYGVSLSAAFIAGAYLF